MRVFMLRVGRALPLAVSLAGCANLSSEGDATGVEALEQGRRAWVAGEYQAALTPLQTAARAGNPRARYALGYMFFHGRGVAQDRARGIELIRRAAKRGDSKAIEALGMLAELRGGPADAHQDGVASGSIPAGMANGARVAGPGTGEQAPPARFDNAREPARASGTAAGNPPAADEWFANRDPRRYTIELLAVRDHDTVERYRELYLSRNPPPEPVRVVEIMRRERRWLLLVMGDYADRNEARRVIDGLPPLLKAGKPEPVQFRNLSLLGPQTAIGDE